MGRSDVRYRLSEDAGAFDQALIIGFNIANASFEARFLFCSIEIGKHLTFGFKYANIEFILISD